MSGQIQPGAAEISELIQHLATLSRIIEVTPKRHTKNVDS